MYTVYTQQQTKGSSITLEVNNSELLKKTVSTPHQDPLGVLIYSECILGQVVFNQSHHRCVCVCGFVICRMKVLRLESQVF